MRKMKDSGIEWIGEIPEVWDTIRFKYLHSQSNVGNSIDKEYWSSENEDTVFYTAGLFPIHTSYTDFPIEKYTSENDLLLARNGTPYVYFPVPDAVYSDHIIRVGINKRYCKRYIGYCLQQSISFEIVDTVSIATWSVSVWDKQFLCLPPIQEQQKIAAFLDHKCSEIDSVIEKTKATIEEYKSLKQSVITQAVTKGIRKGRKMKDSRIEWIGEIPEEWNKCRIKHIFTTYSGATPKSEKKEYWDGDIIWITPADFKTEQVYIEKGKRTITFEGYKSCGATLIPPNSIVFSKRAPIGTVVINTKELCTNQGCLSCGKI